MASGARRIKSCTQVGRGPVAAGHITNVAEKIRTNHSADTTEHRGGREKRPKVIAPILLEYEVGSDITLSARACSCK